MHIFIDQIDLIVDAGFDFFSRYILIFRVAPFRFKAPSSAMPSCYHHQCRGTIMWARHRAIPQTLALLGIFMHLQIRLPINVLQLICDYIPEMFTLCRHIFGRCPICNRYRCTNCGARYFRGDTIAVIPPSCMCRIRRSRRLAIDMQYTTLARPEPYHYL